MIKITWVNVLLQTVITLKHHLGTGTDNLKKSGTVLDKSLNAN